MAFTSMSQVAAAMPGQSFDIIKETDLAGGTFWQTTWLQPGFPDTATSPSPGVAGEVVTSAFTGAVPIRNPGGANKLYLARFLMGIAGQIRGRVVIFDRLLQNSGITTGTSAQTLNTTALNRPDANGDNVEAWWEARSSTGSGGAGITISYTNQAGTSGRTGTALDIGTSNSGGRTGPFSLETGDTGVRSVQSWTNGGTWATVSPQLALRRRICEIDIESVSEGVVMDVLSTGMPEILSNAALEFLVFLESNAQPTILGHLSIIEG